jgi:hypothetical protein
VLHFITLCITLFSFLAADAFAGCLHTLRQYQGSVEATSQQALIFWRVGREELILKVDDKLQAADRTLPRLAWVVPVPARPDGYAVVESPEIFEEAFRLTEGPPTRGGPAVSRITVVQQVDVGEYRITALKAKGPAAAQALNRWLSKQGFRAIPRAHMQYYTDRKWTFLAIQVNPEKGAASLKQRGGLRPLRLSFAANQIYYPLKFAAHQGVFNVTVYVFTERPVSSPDWLQEHAFEQHERSTEITQWPWEAGAPALYDLVQKLAQGKLGWSSTLYLTKFVGHEINAKGKELEGWTRDSQLAVEP